MGEPTMLVKLNERGVRAYMASGGAGYRRHADWQSRTGQISKYSRDHLHAYVIWKGNRSWDRVLVDLIEPCSFAPDIADSPVSH
jgi:hypothetical protein